MVSYARIKFENVSKSNFFGELRTEIEKYFEAHRFEKHGGLALFTKALIMLGLYFIPYVLMLSLDFTGLQMWFLSFIMGLGIAGIGMSVMHDAIHGSFSENSTINTIFGASLYFLGGNVQNWAVQHNQLHHTYTNIHGLDEDISSKPFLRLCFSEKLKNYHKYQHFYAPLLYSLMTFSFLAKDFKEIRLYKKMSATGLVKAFSTKDLIVLFATKIAYIIFVLVLPLYFIENLSFLQWLLGFFTMHCVAGVILSFVFQLAHVVDGTDQPMPNDKGSIQNAWAIHQLLTTANFAGGNKLFSWFIGGLDYQVEHHLFPKISHIHYPALSKIVERLAHKYEIPYNNKQTFWKALGSHFYMLKLMGRHQIMPVA
jgi:linoleoyl-CoA desaturase